MGKNGQATLGVDLGGTSIRVGLYDEGMRLMGIRSMPTQVSAGPQACVEEMAEAVGSLLREHQGYEAVGIGIGSPGPINLRTGVLGLLPNLPGWENYPLRDRLAEATGLTVILESDANAAAIAEWKLGAGQAAGIDSMAMITLGTGVGSGLILAGRVWHGMFGMGGEVGHATVDPQGLRCGCGSLGCLEMYCSAKGLKRVATEVAASPVGTAAMRGLVGQNGDFTPRAVADLAVRESDAGALMAYERLGSYLGIGIANLINTLDLPMVIVGGGVASAWALFAPAMFRAVRDYSVVYRLVTPTQLDLREVDRTYICPAVLGPSAGLLGAGLLPRLADLNGISANATLSSEMTR